jgi:drug/metabolite transporter (DMT)-like permease
MPRSSWFGIALVVISTIAIAIVPTFAKLAYDGGANTLSIITARSILSIAIMTAILPLAKTSLRIRPRPMLIGLAMGVVYAALLYGYIGAVQFLPVNRVVLIVFIHPLLVSFIVMYRGKEGITATAVTASVVALIGLVLAIGLSADSLDPRGIGLAAVAMLTAVVYILGNASAVREASSLAVAFYVMLSAAATLSILFAVFGQTALPTTALSWIGFVGAGGSRRAGHARSGRRHHHGFRCHRNDGVLASRSLIGITVCHSKWVTQHRRSHLTGSFAKERDEVAAKMTPEQIAEPQRLARAWKPTK